MARANHEGRSRAHSRDDSAAISRKRSRYLEGVKQIRLNDYELLHRFVTDHGKIIPSRLTGATAKQQREIRHGIRRARNMGILP